MVLSNNNNNNNDEEFTNQDQNQSESIKMMNDNDNVEHIMAPSSVKTNDEYQKAITPRPLRYTILILTIIESIIFSGLIFGWPALFYMLKNEHIYSHLCYSSSSSSSKPIILNDLIDDYDDDDDGDISTNLLINTTLDNNNNNELITTTTSPLSIISTTLADISMLAKNNNSLLSPNHNTNCIPQENILNMAYTIGIFAMGFTSFAWGFLLESKGLRFVRIALNILISIGCLLLSITHSDISIQIIPAIILLGLIGVPLRIANMQIADYFPKKRSTIIALFSGAFSSSPVIFVTIKYFYDNFGLSYFWSTFSLFIISITLLPLNTYCLPKLSVRRREKKLMNRYDEYYFKINKINNPDNGLDKNKPFKSNKPYFIDRKLFKAINDRYDEHQQQQQHQQQESLLKSDKNKPIIVNFTRLQQEKLASKNLNENELPLYVSLFSLSFLIHQLWFSWINTYMVLYSGSMALWLDRVTDDIHEKRRYTQTFGLVQVSALIIAPIAGDVIDRILKRAQNVHDGIHRRLIQAKSGFGPILFTTLTLFVAVVCRFFDESIAVYVSIIFITILRALFIAVASAYLRIRYPASHFNRLNGIMCTVGAFFSLLQFPLFYFESQSNYGALQVNIVCAILTIICLLNPFCLYFDSIQQYLIEHEERKGQRLMMMNERNNNNNNNNNTIN